MLIILVNAADKLCMEREDDECKFCYKSYQNLDGVCVEPVKEVEGCRSYDDYQNCWICDPYYYLEQDYTCSKIAVDKCMYSNILFPNRCAICENSILEVNGKCETSRTCNDENCAGCLTRFTCLICKEGFALYKGDCRTAPTKNCAVIGDDEKTCSMCRVGSYVDGTECPSVDGVKRELTAEIL